MGYGINKEDLKKDKTLNKLKILSNEIMKKSDEVLEKFIATYCKMNNVDPLNVVLIQRFCGNRVEFSIGSKEDEV